MLTGSLQRLEQLARTSTECRADSDLSVHKGESAAALRALCWGPRPPRTGRGWTPALPFTLNSAYLLNHALPQAISQLVFVHRGVPLLLVQMC